MAIHSATTLTMELETSLVTVASGTTCSQTPADTMMLLASVQMPCVALAAAATLLKTPRRLIHMVTAAAGTMAGQIPAETTMMLTSRHLPCAATATHRALRAT